MLLKTFVKPKVAKSLKAYWRVRKRRKRKK